MDRALSRQDSFAHDTRPVTEQVRLAVKKDKRTRFFITRTAYAREVDCMIISPHTGGVWGLCAWRLLQRGNVSAVWKCCCGLYSVGMSQLYVDAVAEFRLPDRYAHRGAEAVDGVLRPTAWMLPERPPNAAEMISFST